MKRKNIFWSLLTMVSVVMACGLAAACGSDDEKPDAVIGTWTGINSNNGEHTLTLTFAKGSTGTYTLKHEDPLSGTETKTGTFTYTPEGDTRGMVVMKVYDSVAGASTDVYYYTIDDNVMHLYKQGYYSDLRWTLNRSGSAAPGTAVNKAIGTWAGTNGRESLTLMFNAGNAGECIYRYEKAGSLATEVTTFVYAPEGTDKGVLGIKFSANYTGTSKGLFFYVTDGKTIRLYEHGYYDGLVWTLMKQ